MIELQNVTIGFDQPLFSVQHAKVQPGEVVALLGANGSGKSTLLRSVLGLQPILGGSISVKGSNIQSLSSTDRAKLLSWSAANQLPNGYWTVDGILALHPCDKSTLEQVMEQFELNDFQSKFVYELSEGQRQRLAVARAFLQPSEFVLLDEPIAFLDLSHQANMLQQLRKAAAETKRGVLWTTHHILQALQHSDQIWWIDETTKQLICGTKSDLLQNNRFSALYAQAKAVLGS